MRDQTASPRLLQTLPDGPYLRQIIAHIVRQCLIDMPAEWTFGLFGEVDKIGFELR
jgi:hypothetical protein